MMIVLLCLVAVTRAASSGPTELKDCDFCHRKAARCVVGHVAQNQCVRCTCSPDRLYNCTSLSPACDAQEIVILGKPTKARCDPHMIYELGALTCMCSKDGFWPHDKCERAFYSLHNPQTNNTKLKDNLDSEKDNLDSDIKKMIAANYEIKKLVITNHDPSASEHRKLQDTKDDHESKGEGGVESGDSCEPNAYFFRDCNVCKCSAVGSVERCTQNKCGEQTGRRVYDNVQGSCVPHNWYALAPCQFCYCQQSNKLVCSTQYNDYSNLLALGSYNLTNCGPNLVKELYELSPDANVSNNLLREGAEQLAPPPTPASTPSPNPRATAQTATINSSSRPYDADLQVSVLLKKPNEAEAAKVEYETETEEETASEGLRVGQEQSTLSPFENEEESVEGETPKPITNQYVKLPNGNYKQVVNQEPASLKIPAPQPSVLNALMTVQGMPQEMVRILESMPEVSQMHSPMLEPAQQETRNYDVSIQEAKPDQKSDQKPDQKAESHVVRINLPSVVERIIKLALRKSMVKIDSSQTCTPGTTSQDGCNYCYCLTNGKLLCTDKKTC